MPLYEVVPPEFYEGTDATDHLILWGKADRIEDVQARFPNCKVEELGPFFVTAANDFDLRKVRP